MRSGRSGINGQNISGGACRGAAGVRARSSARLQRFRPRFYRARMNRLLAPLLLVVASSLLALVRAQEKPRPAITHEEIPAPAAAGALGANLFRAPDGRVWLSWVEPAAPGKLALRCATLDAAAKKWSAPRTISTEPTLTASQGDFPQFAINAAGRAWAIWTDGKGGARVTESRDGGATWSASAAFAPPGIGVEKFSLAVLDDGRVLAAWLDDRAKKSGGKMSALYARVLGSDAPDQLVDDAVCDCCQTELTAFLDGGALVAYRARTVDEVRDIRTARLRGNIWEAPRTLHPDNWKIAGCPMNAARLASEGGRVAAAWFTAADGDARVLASLSPD
ncbi:MAG: hypothetical protein RLZZ15_635, partial [Verrucomicrobiota bacterium]